MRIQLAQEEYGYPSGPFFWPTSLSDLTRNDDEPGISSRKCIKIPCPQIFVWGVFFMYFQKSGSLENIPKWLWLTRFSDHFPKPRNIQTILTCCKCGYDIIYHIITYLWIYGDINNTSYIIIYNIWCIIESYLYIYDIWTQSLSQPAVTNTTALMTTGITIGAAAHKRYPWQKAGNLRESQAWENTWVPSSPVNTWIDKFLVGLICFKVVYATAARSELGVFAPFYTFMTFICTHTCFLCMISCLIHMITMFDATLQTSSSHDYAYLPVGGLLTSFCTCSHVRCYASDVFFTWSHNPSGGGGYSVLLSCYSVHVFFTILYITLTSFMLGCTCLLCMIVHHANTLHATLYMSSLHDRTSR